MHRWSLPPTARPTSRVWSRGSTRITFLRSRLSMLRTSEDSSRRNTGAGSRGRRLHLFLGQDDRVGESWLSAMVAELGHHPFVAARLEPHRLNSEWTGAIYGETQREELLTLSCSVPFAFGGSIGVSRMIYDQIGGFDENLGTETGEDIDYCYRIQLREILLVPVRDAVCTTETEREHGSFRQLRRYSFDQVLTISRYVEYGVDRGSLLRGIASRIDLLTRWKLEPVTSCRRGGGHRQRGRGSRCWSMRPA